jgi:hypothetical protein
MVTVDRHHVMKAQRANRSSALLVLNTDTRRDAVYKSRALVALFRVKDPYTV